MSHDRISLNDDWMLGWQKNDNLNRWIVGFNSWQISGGKLIGRPTSYTRGLIYANYSVPGDQTVSVRFTLGSDDCDFRPILCYCITRLSGYYLVLRTGAKPNVYYVYSELFDHQVIGESGPVLEKDREYSLTYHRSGSMMTILLDDEEIAAFEISEYCGDYTAFAIMAGEVRIGSVSIYGKDSDEELFSDCFTEDTLSRSADIQLEDLHPEKWIDAVVPGTVHTSLLEAGIIEDPYIPFNGPKCHWVCDMLWIYRKRFTVPKAFEGKRLRLLFHGVDYCAVFWLNGMRLCFHEGMFGGPELDITDIVDSGNENELTVCILPCPNPPHNNVRPYILHRWHFNMDIITSGIWRGVELIADDKIFLSDPQVVTRRISPDGTALVDLSVTVSTMALWPFDVQGRFIMHSPAPEDGDIVATFAPGFCQGSIRVTCSAEIPNARLWWPAGMGDQNLYDVDISVDLYEHQKQHEPTAHDELHLRTGIRTLKTAPMPPSDEDSVKNNSLGLYNWCFTVNGRAFFAKGSNWMPTDQLLRLDRERYRRLLTRAVDSSINMLRLWGAGLFETDDFYDLCDEMGICVWQETLFANGIYDGSSIDVWRETIRRSILRLRNHPSLAIYCGGNEFDPDLPQNRDIIDEIEAMIGELDPSRPFHRASPYGGDNHSYLANWMGGSPYTVFYRDMSTAITEYSQASPPCMDTLKRLIPEDELDAFPPDMPEDIFRYDYTSWGREDVARRESSFSILDAHLSGITSIMFPPMSDAGIPHSMEEFVEYLQTTQGLLTQFGIGTWRSRWPRCTAALSWVFNVIFPDSMSWSYVDYYLMPKRSYYYQKRAFDRISITAVFEELFNEPGDTLRIMLSVSNEELTGLENAVINARLYDSELKLIASMSKTVSIRPDDTRNAGWFCYDIPSDMKDQVLFLCTELTDSKGNLLSRSHHCPRVGKKCSVMPYLSEGPWISDVRKAATTLEGSFDISGNEITVHIKNTGLLPAFQAYIHSPGMDHLLRYSDNCLWIEPGEEFEIRVLSFEELPSSFEISAWNAKAVNIRKESEVD
ncbi:MAG: hypothetical protein IJS22_02795 [Lachnospiraceae bacterium]|nr:hypothetical protein [Lachnospiraceae bacterium]